MALKNCERASLFPIITAMMWEDEVKVEVEAAAVAHISL